MSLEDAHKRNEPRASRRKRHQEAGNPASKTRPAAGSSGSSKPDGHGFLRTETTPTPTPSWHGGILQAVTTLGRPRAHALVPPPGLRAVGNGPRARLARVAQNDRAHWTASLGGAQPWGQGQRGCS